MNEAASRLCRACGLCCDGSLFPTVQLQPADSAQALKALGLRIQHKKKCDFFDQPCSAFKNKSCSIYQERPVRCRAFECQQLKRLAQGETREEDALKKIQEAQSMIDVIKKLFYRLGPTNPKKPLLQQYQQIIADPIDSFQNSTSDANCGLTPVLASSSINYTLSLCAPRARATSLAEANFERSLSTPSPEKKVVEERAQLNEALSNLNEFFNQEFRCA